MRAKVRTWVIINGSFQPPVIQVRDGAVAGSAIPGNVARI
jgi:hypothetical protein